MAPSPWSITPKYLQKSPKIRHNLKNWFILFGSPSRGYFVFFTNKELKNCAEFAKKSIYSTSADRVRATWRPYWSRHWEEVIVFSNGQFKGLPFRPNQLNSTLISSWRARTDFSTQGEDFQIQVRWDFTNSANSIKSKRCSSRWWGSTAQGRLSVV